MSKSSSESDSSYEKQENRTQAAFARTHWSIIVAAGDPNDSAAQNALNELCRAYWNPIYAFIRRQGNAPHDAEDLTQGFLAWFLQKNYIGIAQQEKGKFRSFLLTRLKFFLSHEYERARAQKRSGGKEHIPFDAEEAEAQYQRELSDQQSPDRLYERRWSVTVVNEALKALERRYVADGNKELFQQLLFSITATEAAVPYAQLATRLSMTENNVKQAVNRLRKRYREAIRDEVAKTVPSPADVEEELRYLMSVVKQ